MTHDRLYVSIRNGWDAPFLISKSTSNTIDCSTIKTVDRSAMRINPNEILQNDAQNAFDGSWDL